MIEAEKAEQRGEHVGGDGRDRGASRCLDDCRPLYNRRHSQSPLVQCALVAPPAPVEKPSPLILRDALDRDAIVGRVPEQCVFGESLIAQPHAEPAEGPVHCRDLGEPVGKIDARNVSIDLSVTGQGPERAVGRAEPERDEERIRSIGPDRFQERDRCVDANLRTLPLDNFWLSPVAAQWRIQLEEIVVSQIFLVAHASRIRGRSGLDSTDMPLPEVAGAVAGVTEYLGNGDFLRPSRMIGSKYSGSVGMATSENRCTGGRAVRSGGVEAVKPKAFGGHVV